MEGSELKRRRGVRVPIGRPISNTHAHLLDPALRPVPVGAVGQLHAGGDGPAREHAGRTDLTAENFALIEEETQNR